MVSRGLPKLCVLIMVAGGLCRGGTIVDLVPAITFTFNDNVVGNTITISNGPMESGDPTLSIMADGLSTIVIANKVNVIVNDEEGGDTFNVDFATLSTGLASLTLDGGDGADSFLVTPAGVPITVVGGGNPQTAPGNVLDVNLIGTTSASLSDSSTADGLQGSWTFANESAVDFSGIETLSTPAPEPGTAMMAAIGLLALFLGGKSVHSGRN